MRIPKRLSDERWLTIAAVARCLGVSRAKVYGLIASGQVPHTRIGEQTLIPQSGIDALLGAQFVPSRPDVERRAS